MKNSTACPWAPSSINRDWINQVQPNKHFWRHWTPVKMGPPYTTVIWYSATRTLLADPAKQKYQFYFLSTLLQIFSKIKIQGQILLILSLTFLIKNIQKKYISQIMHKHQDRLSWKKSKLVINCWIFTLFPASLQPAFLTLSSVSVADGSEDGGGGGGGRETCAHLWAKISSFFSRAVLNS